MDLSGGIISKILIDAAGPSLQEECSQKAPIAPGQIAITGSGNINCKYLFHLALNNYDGPGGSAEKVTLHATCKVRFTCVALFSSDDTSNVIQLRVVTLP